MNKEELLNTIKTTPSVVAFTDVMSVVESSYDFTPTAFKNGNTNNEVGQNSGSCKLFAFAKLNNLTKEETLNCFGDYYRKDVLDHPEKDDHQNIRNFIESGWEGVLFEGDALS
jgi:hypothetical protein